ncbi:MAG: patatin-like phospholipase family protein [Rhodospirillales bacterium]|nr:patatin-like phospholipase family protein [Rhodospirillales bacterium]
MNTGLTVARQPGPLGRIAGAWRGAWRPAADWLAQWLPTPGITFAAIGRPRRKALSAAKSLNLALQGGGAHGAFTWGVLERLISDGRLRFDAVSGTSAGAVNAVLLAAGLMEGGVEAAQVKLEEFWRNISHSQHHDLMSTPVLDAMSVQTGQSWGTPGQIFGMVSRFLSPYQFNPLDYNPLRQNLEALVDFPRLRRRSPLRLYIAATDVASGRRRVFETGELTVDMVLASACLPHVHQAVKVGTRYYWDGGYSANPVLLPLVHDADAEDTMLVQLIPLVDLDLPTKPPEIYERLNRIIFNAPLRSEIEMIALGQSLSRKGLVIGNRAQRHFRRHRFHHIDAAPYTQGLEPGSRLNPDWGMISHLRENGRHAAEEWLERYADAVGRRSTADFAATFL